MCRQAVSATAAVFGTIGCGARNTIATVVQAVEINALTSTRVIDERVVRWAPNGQFTSGGVINTGAAGDELIAFGVIGLRRSKNGVLNQSSADIMGSMLDHREYVLDLQI